MEESLMEEQKKNNYKRKRKQEKQSQHEDTEWASTINQPEVREDQEL